MYQRVIPSNVTEINGAGLGGGGCYKSTRAEYFNQEVGKGAGLGGGGCYEDFRDDTDPRADLLLESCIVDIEIQPTHKFAVYRIAYHLKVLSNSQDTWSYLVVCADSKYTQRIVLINCHHGRRNYIPFKWCR